MRKVDSSARQTSIVKTLPLKALPLAADISPLMSVVMPVYNEFRLLPTIVERVRAVPIDHELIIIDDGSADGCTEFLSRMSSKAVVVCRHASNRGKGAALKTGFSHASGEIIVIQDADLEYVPEDLCRIIEPIRRGAADVVYGSRFLSDSDTNISLAMFWANRLITWFYNRFALHSLTDVETCYKAIRSDVLQRILVELQEERFGIEIELCARLDKLADVRIVEIPVRYSARNRRQGKKIRLRDGLRALWCIVKYHRARYL